MNVYWYLRYVGLVFALLVAHGGELNGNDLTVHTTHSR